MVPRMTLVVPLRRRLQFTTNLLPTAVLHAERKGHEIIIIVDACPVEYEIARRPEVVDAVADRMERDLVLRWLDEHARLLDQHGIRVLESRGDERCWTGGLRCSAALNTGVQAATTDWIVGIGDEDLAMPVGWDASLWRGIEDHDPDRTVSTLVLCQPEVLDAWPNPLTSEWIHATRKTNRNRLAFPVTRAQSGFARIRWSSFERFAEIGKLPGIHEEPCGARQMTHWVPFLMSKPLLDRIGRWPIADEFAMSPDVELDNMLARASVMKRMPLDALMLHAKEHLYISDDIDEEWGHAERLRLYKDRV